MATLIFNTYHAPEAEIDGVKAALKIAGISYYETCKGKWGIGSAAIWVNNADDYLEARSVVDAFQREWVEKARRQPASTNIQWERIPALAIAIAVVLFLTFFWYF